MSKWYTAALLLLSILIYSALFVVRASVPASPPIVLVALSLAGSVFFVASAVMAVHLLLNRKKEPGSSSFIEIVYGTNRKPSLSLFQFLVWTCIIAVSYLWFYLLNILFEADEFIAMSLPAGLLVLMGISYSVPLISFGISSSNEPESAPVAAPADSEAEIRPLGTMLNQYDSDKPSLTRFQMFLWTWVGVVIYIALLLYAIQNFLALPGDYPVIQLPDIDPTILFLMGLSQASYLTGKATGEKKKTPPATVVSSSAASATARDNAVAGQDEKTRVVPIREMPEDVRSYLVHDHPEEEAEAVRVAVSRAELSGFFRYYIIGGDFAYLIENGQIRGHLKGDRRKIWEEIQKRREETGSAEMIEI